MTDAIGHKTGGGALWGVTNGRVIIHIPANANDKGVIFYEMFHGAFDHSPLEAQHDKWAADAGAAWCNAFRYLMEFRHVPDSPWLAEVDKRMAAGVNVSISAPNPDLILFYCGKNYERFKTFWKERQARSRESLDKFFAAQNWTTLQEREPIAVTKSATEPPSDKTATNPTPVDSGKLSHAAGSPTVAPSPALEALLRMGMKLDPNAPNYKAKYKNWHNSMRVALEAAYKSSRGGVLSAAEVGYLGGFDAFDWDRSGGTPDQIEAVKYVAGLMGESLEVPAPAKAVPTP